MMKANKTLKQKIILRKLINIKRANKKLYFFQNIIELIGIYKAYSSRRSKYYQKYIQREIPNN